MVVQLLLLAFRFFELNVPVNSGSVTFESCVEHDATTPFTVTLSEVDEPPAISGGSKTIDPETALHLTVPVATTRTFDVFEDGCADALRSPSKATNPHTRRMATPRLIDFICPPIQNAFDGA
jgi:hypothetical protein